MNNHLPSIQAKETRALVIGSGIAGLLAARVLSDYYDHIQIVERDRLPERADYRAGTPQAFHIHRIVGRGQASMERLIPNLFSELVNHGAVSTHNKKTRVANVFGQIVVPSAEEAMCGRPLREWTIRQYVQALSNVQFSTGIEAIGLQMDPEHTRVTGVHVRQHGQIEQSSTLNADLIIDTSGRSTKLTQWLQSSGYDVPEPEHLKSELGYATRYYKVSPQFAKEWAGVVIVGDSSRGVRTAYSLLRENDTLGVILFGAGGHYPSTDNNEYDQQLRELTSMTLADMLQAEAEPITSPRGYRIVECLRQHFDQMERWPLGLLAMGDALCNLDPIYGHGMTLAALEAEMLDACLNAQRSNPQLDFERRTLRSLQEVIQPAWWIDAITDLTWPEVTYNGQEPPKAVALVQRYLRLYLQEATKRMVDYSEYIRQGGEVSSTPPDPFSPEPSLLPYTLMNDLTISPRVVFNATAYRLLLDIEATQEGSHQLQELTNAYGLSLEEILDDILPVLHVAFPNSPAELAANLGSLTLTK